MLIALDGKQITTVAHAATFASVLAQLGPARSAEVRAGPDNIISALEPNKETGVRSFSSSQLGSQLTPWPHPVSQLYDVAWELEGAGASDDHVESRAALLFGQFVWECVMNRDEEWVFYDHNLDPRDPNREITGKIYFERS